MQKGMKPPSLDIKKPIKLKIDCEAFADSQITNNSQNYRSALKQMEGYVEKNSALPPELTRKVFILMKPREQNSQMQEKISIFRKSSKSNVRDKQNQINLNMSQSANLDNSNQPLPTESLLLESKETLNGRIKLKKIVNNKKVELGECQEATPIKSGLIIKNMREKLKKVLDEKEKAENKVCELQKHIESLQEEKKDYIPHPDSLVRIQCLFNLNLVEKMDKKEEKIVPKVEQVKKMETVEGCFKDELIQNLKNMVACQNIEIQNLQNKLIAKKQTHKSRWIES